jgi:hypothetical protein
VIVDKAQLHADPESPRVFRANHVRVSTLQPHCTDCVQPVDVARAKSFEDRFSPLVRSSTEQDVLRLLTLLTGEKVTDASEGKGSVLSLSCVILMPTCRQQGGPYA